MKYLCLVYLEDDKLHAVRDSECLAASERLRADGRVVAAEALHPVAHGDDAAAFATAP